MYRNFQPYKSDDFSNPIFKREWGRLRRLKTPQARRFYNWLWLFCIPFVIGIWWFSQQPTIEYARGIFPRSQYASTALVYLSLFVMVVSSLFTIVYTVSYFHKLLHSQEWELLSLSNQSAESILQGYLKILQARLWWLIVIEVGLRYAIALSLLVFSLYSNYTRFNPNAPDREIRFFILHLVLFIFYAIYFVPIVAYGYEPVTRLKTTIAICMDAATSKHDYAFRMTLAFLRHIFIYVVQAAIFTLLAYMLFNADFLGNDEDDFLFLSCCPPIWFVAMGVLHALYKIIGDHALKSASRQLAVPD